MFAIRYVYICKLFILSHIHTLATKSHDFPVALGMDSGKRGRSYLTWRDQMDKAMLDVFVDHDNKGNCAQNGWKPHVYTAAVKNVREKCEKEITKDHIISRSKTFDKHYLVISKMLCQSGFGWDCDNNMISVDSEDVWNNYVKVNSSNLFHSSYTTFIACS